MSCLRRVRTTNRVKPENRNPFDKHMVYCNCGNCAGCNKQKQNDWLVRAYYEYMSKPTDAFFVTLDFDDEHIPRYKDTNCFDSELMTGFLENFRHSLPPVRYMYSSHYGEALNRPHYHALFFFDKGAITEDEFFFILNDKWKFGSHTDISRLRSCTNKGPMAAVKYICKYTIRNTKFLYQVRKFNMPARFRPRTYASVGFGAQALDPNEFDSKRLINQGLMFYDRPIITKEYLRNNNVVYLDIKQDGVLVPFTIPRYYLTKLGYDSEPVMRYVDVDGRATLVQSTALKKNDFGKELQELRYNRDYDYLYNEFVNSRLQPIHLDDYTQSIIQEVFPNNCYLGVTWKDVVDDVLIDKEKFRDFCHYYPWIVFDTSKPGYYNYRPALYQGDKKISYDEMHKLDISKIYRPSTFHCTVDSHDQFDVFDVDIDLYILAMSIYQIWKDVELHRQAEFEDWKANEAVKDKIKEKCKTDIGYYRHLRRKNFKFYKLNHSSYVSRYSSRTYRFSQQSAS